MKLKNILALCCLVGAGLLFYMGWQSSSSSSAPVAKEVVAEQQPSTEVPPPSTSPPTPAPVEQEEYKPLIIPSSYQGWVVRVDLVNRVFRYIPEENAGFIPTTTKGGHISANFDTPVVYEGKNNADHVSKIMCSKNTEGIKEFYTELTEEEKNSLLSGMIPKVIDETGRVWKRITPEEYYSIASSYKMVRVINKKPSETSDWHFTVPMTEEQFMRLLKDSLMSPHAPEEEEQPQQPEIFKV